MSVVVEDDSGKHVLICKGALEETMEVCTSVLEDGKSEALTPKKITGIL